MLCARAVGRTRQHIRQTHRQAVDDHQAVVTSPVSDGVNLKMVGQQRVLFGPQDSRKPGEVGREQIFAGGTFHRQQVINDPVIRPRPVGPPLKLKSPLKRCAGDVRPVVVCGDRRFVSPDEKLSEI